MFFWSLCSLAHSRPLMLIKVRDTPAQFKENRNYGLEERGLWRKRGPNMGGKNKTQGIESKEYKIWPFGELFTLKWKIHKEYK